MSTPKSVDLPPGVVSERWPVAGGHRAVLHTGLDDADAWALLVPGFTGSKEDFIAVVPLLAQAGIGVVAVDQLGQCDSSHGSGEDDYALPALAADLGRIVDAARRAGASGAPHLVGHSFGGLVVQQAVGDGVLDLRSLTLLGTGPSALPADRHAGLTDLRAALATTSLAEIWPHLPAAQRSMPADVEAFVRRRWLANDPEQLRAAAHVLMTQTDLTTATRAGLGGRATLVAWGEHDDDWPVAVQRAMARDLGAEAVELAGCGHSPNVDDPAALAAALLGCWRD